MAGIMAEMWAEANRLREAVKAGVEEREAAEVAEELALSRVHQSEMTAEQADRIQQLWRNLWDGIEAAGYTTVNMHPSEIPTTRRLITALLNVTPLIIFGGVEPPLRVQHLRRALNNIDARFTAALERQAFLSHSFSVDWDNRDRRIFLYWANTELEDLRHQMLSQEVIDLIDRGLDIMKAEIEENRRRLIRTDLARPPLEREWTQHPEGWAALTTVQEIARQAEEDAWQEEAIAFFEQEGRDTMQGAQFDEWLENDHGLNPFEPREDRTADHPVVPAQLLCPPGHLFCRHCVTSWFMEASTCPLCRHPFVLPCLV